MWRKHNLEGTYIAIVTATVLTPIFSNERANTSAPCSQEQGIACQAETHEHEQDIASQAETHLFLIDKDDNRRFKSIL